MSDYEIYYELKPLSNCGDLMTLDEFIEACKSGGFIDYDGYGYYSFETKQSNIIVVPSEIMDGHIRREFTHVLWLNR